MTTLAYQHIDLSYLEMMADGDDFMKKTMLDMLLEEMPPELEKLREAYLTQDAEALRAVAHKMKSTLAFVGNPAMSEANATMEDIGRDGADMSRVGPLLEQFESAYETARPELEAESARLDA